MDMQGVLILVAVVAAIIIYIVGREKINLRKAANGEDKERLKRAVAQALPGESGYQVVYGHYEKVEHFGRKTRTTYYCYALAFDASRLWVLPLRFDKEHILPGEPVLITSDALGIADTVIANDKEGKACRVSLTLYDKTGASFLDCVVEVNNTREDRFHHVNIIQEEECARFGRFIGAVSAQVNRDNAELKEQVHAAEASARKASILGIVGVILGIVFPPIGLILSVIGIRVAKNGRTGDKASYPLMLCRGALVVSILFTLLEGAVLIYAFLIK